MGILRDRINAKIRSRRGAKSVSDEVSETSATEVTSSTQFTSTREPPPSPPASTTPSFAPSHHRRIPPIPGVSSSASSTHTRTTIQDASTKVRRLLRTHRPSRSTTSANSAHLEDVPEPEPRLLPLNPATAPSVQQYPPDTPLTDGYVSLTVPHAWRAVRADDAIYLLSGQGVGFVKAVRAVDACEVLLEVGRLSVMSHVLVRSSPVWEGCEACVQYSLVGGFGIGIARFQDGFDAGAVVFAVCAPNDKRQLVMDALDSIRQSARVVKVPESEEKNKNNREVIGEKKGDGEAKVTVDTKGDCVGSRKGKGEAGCVVQ